MAVVLAALLTIVVVCVVTYVLISLRNLRYWQRKNVPCLRPEFLFGNFRDVVLGKKMEEDVISELYWKLDGKRFGGVYQGHSPALLVRDPQLVKDMVTKAFETFPTRTMEEFEPGKSGATICGSILRENVFNTEGQVWRELRGRLTPAFTPGRVRRTVGDLQRHADLLVEQLKEAAESGEEVALKGPLLAYSVDTVSSALFGLDANALANPDSELLRMAELLERDPGAVHASAEACAPAAVRLTKRLRDGDATHTRVAKFFVGIATDVLAARSTTGCEARDFLQLLADNQMEEVVNEGNACERRVGVHVCALLYAGAHKPSALACCALWELSAAPRLQERLRAECDAVAAEGEGEPGHLSALESAPLLDAVLSETLRKYPVEPLLTRVNRLPYVIPGTNLELPPGTRVLLPVAAIQRDASFYPQPEAFKPQRFLSPENDIYCDVVSDYQDDNSTDTESDYSETCSDPLYLPFGAGPRKCIGYRLGLLQTKVAVATLLRHYQFAPATSKSRPYLPVLRIVPRVQ